MLNVETTSGGPASCWQSLQQDAVLLSASSAESPTCVYSCTITALCRSEEADERNKLTSRLSDVESSYQNQRLEYQSVHAR